MADMLINRKGWMCVFDRSVVPFCVLARLRALLLKPLLAVCLLAASLSQAEVPSDVVIGVPELDVNESFLEGDSLSLRLIRSVVSTPLLRERIGHPGMFSLVLADSFHVDTDVTVWSYRIRDGVVFSNNQVVRGADVCFSLLRCNASSDGIQVQSCSVRDAGLLDSTHEWIDLRFSEIENKKERQEGVIGFLSRCPIIEKSSSEVFSSDLGRGVNVVASGDYKFSGFLANRNIRFGRFQRDRLGTLVPKQDIELRAFSSMRDALNALRMGTIGLFFNHDPEIEQVALSDQTLLVSDCSGEQVIYRRGFQFECQDGMVLKSLSWEIPPQ